MIKRFAFAAMVLALLGVTEAAWPIAEERFATYQGTAPAPDHGAFAALLDRYRVAGGDGPALFDYGAVTEADHAALKSYIADLAALDPRQLERDDAFAYWANLYNALTLDVVLDAYPVSSIMEIRSSILRAGPWKKELIEVAERKLSLDDIEHGILRTHWEEPRIHYAVNCASIGCPDLPATPFTGTDLEAQLDAAARGYVNAARGFMVKPDGTVRASTIYRWYKSDFGERDEDVLDHARVYADPALKAALEGKTRIDRYAYDWALNDVR
jgi:NAD(P)-dependent dehydrogenase (short-subunit alcohol dehydrogenase family)